MTQTHDPTRFAAQYRWYSLNIQNGLHWTCFVASRSCTSVGIPDTVFVGRPKGSKLLLQMPVISAKHVLASLGLLLHFFVAIQARFVTLFNYPHQLVFVARRTSCRISLGYKSAHKIYSAIKWGFIGVFAIGLLLFFPSRYNLSVFTLTMCHKEIICRKPWQHTTRCVLSINIHTDDSWFCPSWRLNRTIFRVLQPIHPRDFLPHMSLLVISGEWTSPCLPINHRREGIMTIELLRHFLNT